MSETQRTTLLIVLLVTFFMILVPPWKELGYGLIFDPPYQATQIDFQRLGFQFVLVAIICGAFALLAKPSSASGDISTEEHKPLNKTIKWILATFLSLTCGTIGWHFYQKYDAADRILKAEQKATAEASAREEKRKADQAHRDLLESNFRTNQSIAAAQFANEQAKASMEQEQAIQNRLKKLARPKVFRVNPPIAAGVTTTLQVYWKNNVMFYQVRLKGSATNLEYAVDACPTIKIALLTRDAAPIETLEIKSDSLQALRGRNNAITGMATANQFTECSIEVFENILVAKRVD